MRRLLALLALVTLFAVGGASPVMAGGVQYLAQDETAEEDDGTDWGWIGLLGLAGLAGLLRRDRRDDTERTTSAARTDRVE